MSDAAGDRAPNEARRIRLTDFARAKREGRRWAMLTSYDQYTAGIFDAHTGTPLHWFHEEGMTFTAGVLNLTVVPPVLIAFGVVGWHWVARSRPAVMA